MNEQHQELARRLFDIGAVQFGAFRLKAHEKNPDLPLSPIFLNLRSPLNPKPGPLTDDEYRLAGELMADLAKSMGMAMDCVAGIPHAGDPFADAFAAAWGEGLPVVRLMKETLPNDRRRIGGVAGDEAAVRGKRVLLLDDLITKSHSKLEAITAVQRVGGLGSNVLVLVDREQGGEEGLAAAGCALHAVFRLTELLQFYEAEGFIDDAKRQEVLTYIADN